MSNEFNSHEPVLLKEAIEYLNVCDNKVYVDCTLGRGGHSFEILKKLKNGFLFGFDQDESAINYCQEKFKKYKNFKAIKSNFNQLKVALSFYEINKVDGFIYDLGVSSPQFDDPKRGFSYRFDATLDMRMDLNKSLSAYEIINNFDFKDLKNIFWKYGQEKFSVVIARNIEKKRKISPIKTTFELVEIIKEVLPQKVLKQKKHPAKKVFQALRIYVNDEINSLETSLQQACDLLNLNGRICLISFHSLEENLIKKIFKKLTVADNEKFLNKLPIDVSRNINYKLVNKKPIIPNDIEQKQNKRSHSAKLWVIEKIKEV